MITVNATEMSTLREEFINGDVNITKKIAEEVSKLIDTAARQGKSKITLDTKKYFTEPKEHMERNDRRIRILWQSLKDQGFTVSCFVPTLLDIEW